MAFSRQIIKALIYMDIVGHGGSQRRSHAIGPVGRFADADQLASGPNPDDRKQASIDGAAHGFLGAAIEDCDLPDGQKLAIVTAVGRIGGGVRLTQGRGFGHELRPFHQEKLC
jgi:hypothetical protein